MPAQSQHVQPAYDVFLSYNRADAEAVVAVREQLAAAGIQTFRDNDNLRAGQLWPEALEKALLASASAAVFLGPNGIGRWQKRELYFALDIQAQAERENRSYPVLPVLLDGGEHELGFLFLNTWVDLRGRMGAAAAAADLRTAIRTGKRLEAPDQIVCPYRHLDPFREEDAPFYCGRETFVKQLLGRVRPNSFTAVVGASGSGKSSVILAGLIPVLRRQRPPAVWEAISFKPGGYPWRSLANAFLPVIHPTLADESRAEVARSLAKDLEGGDGALPSAVQQALEVSGARRLLVVVDQFEELLTMTPPSVRTQLIEDLLDAVAKSELAVVITLRADYYSMAIEASRLLADALPSNQVNLGPMLPAELRSAIEDPGKVAGLTLEDGLADRIIRDALGQPGHLPLLEYALAQLWTPESRDLTLRRYEQAGGVAGVVTLRAEAIYAELSPAQKEVAQQLFMRLVRVAPPGQEGADTRMRVRREELSDGEWDVAGRFAKWDARLLTFAQDPESGCATVEVAHEALIRTWARLRDWISVDREFLQWRQRLAFRIEEWNRTGRAEAALLSGRLLEEAQDWLSGRQHYLSPEERSFINWTLTDEYHIGKVRAAAAAVLANADESAAIEWLATERLAGSLEALARAQSMGCRDKVLARVVSALVRDSEIDAAMKALDEMGPGESLKDALVDMALGCYRAGRMDEAIRLGAKALDIAVPSGQEWARELIQQRLISRIVQGDAVELAARLLETRATQDASVLYLSSLTLNIIKSLVPAGKHRAWELIGAVRDGRLADSLRVWLATRLGEVGCAVEARRAISEITDPGSRMAHLVALANSPQTSPLPALEIAEELDAYTQPAVKTAIVCNLVRAGDVELADTEAKRLIRSIRLSGSELPLLRTIIREFALSDQARAMQLAREIAAPDEKARALRGAIEVAARSDDLLFGEQILCEVLRDRSAAESYSVIAAAANLVGAVPPARYEFALSLLGHPEIRALESGETAPVEAYRYRLGLCGYTAIASAIHLPEPEWLRDLNRAYENRAGQWGVLLGFRPEVVDVMMSAIPCLPANELLPQPLPVPAADLPTPVRLPVIRLTAGVLARQRDGTGVATMLKECDEPLQQIYVLGGAVQGAFLGGDEASAREYLRDLLEKCALWLDAPLWAGDAVWLGNSDPHMLLGSALAAAVAAGGDRVVLDVTTSQPEGFRGTAIADVLLAAASSGNAQLAAAWAPELIRHIGAMSENEARSKAAAALADATLLIGPPETASGLIGELPKPADRVTAFSRLAGIHVEHDRLQAARAAVLDAFSAIELLDEYERPEARATAIQPFASAGETEFLRQLAFGLTSEDDRRQLLTDAVCGLAGNGHPDQAVQFAGEIQDDFYRRRALSAAAEHLWKQKGFPEVRIFIDSTGRDRDGVLTDFAKFLAEAGAIVQAIEVSNDIGEEPARRNALANILLVSAVTTSVLMDVGGRIPDRRDRSEAIRQGCTELVKNGRFEVAEELSNRYLSRYENAAVLIATTAAWLNSGRLDRARRWMRACIVNSNYGGRKELSDCLRLFVEAGQSDEAVSLANEIPTASDRAAVLRNIAISISPAADPRVLSTLELALQAIAVAQPSGMLLDESLDALRQDIARILVRHGQWDRALDSAEKIDDLGIRLTTMVEIAAALPADRAQSAKEIVSSTEARLSAVGSDPRARIHGSLGVIYARWRDFAKSRSAVEECHLATEKLKACTAIVREYRAATASVVTLPT